MQFLYQATSQPEINTNASGTVTPSGNSNTYEYTVTGALTIANPANQTPGQIFNFTIKQNSTGGFGISLGTKWILPSSAAFTTTANAVNVMSGIANSDGNIYCSLRTP